MASPFTEKLQVAAITATVTSAAWIVLGSVVLDLRPDEIAAEAVVESGPENGADSAIMPLSQIGEADGAVAPALETAAISQPSEEQTSQLMIPVLEVRAADLVDTFTGQAAPGRQLHEAIDIMAPAGTSVVAAAPGTIERLFNSDVGGNTIYVRSRDGETIHYYAHLDQYAPGLQEGQQVRRGQRLGTVGSTGNASPQEPHLHFAIMRTRAEAEWWEPSTALNPYQLLTANSR